MKYKNVEKSMQYIIHKPSYVYNIINCYQYKLPTRKLSMYQHLQCMINKLKCENFDIYYTTLVLKFEAEFADKLSIYSKPF